MLYLLLVNNCYLFTMGPCLTRHAVIEDYDYTKDDAAIVIKRSSSVDKTITHNLSLQLANSSICTCTDKQHNGGIIAQSFSFTSAKTAIPPPPARQSKLQEYMRNASQNCTDLPTTQRDDKHSTVHALSSKSYFHKSKAFFPADIRVFSIVESESSNDGHLDVASSRQKTISTKDNVVATTDIVPAFLAVLYNNRAKALSFDQVVDSVQELIIQPQHIMEQRASYYYNDEDDSSDDKYNTQPIVKLTSSTPEIDVAFHIIRPAGQGARRAILAGENNDTLCNLLTYLVEVQMFSVENVVVLRGETDEKVKERMLALVENTRGGDSIFFYYSSSSKIRKEKNIDDEEPGSNSIMPLSNGNEIIREKDLVAGFLGPLPADVTVTCLIDSTTEVTVDLPYAYRATDHYNDDALIRMAKNDEFSFLRVVDFLRETCEGLGSNLMFIEQARIFAKVAKAANENLAAQKLLFEF